jgi:hypothetical protein
MHSTALATACGCAIAVYKKAGVPTLKSAPDTSDQASAALRHLAQTVNAILKKMAPLLPGPKTCVNRA